MSPEQLRQALIVRTLRAEKAERALLTARQAERDAETALQAVYDQLEQFDAMLDARIAAFQEQSLGGIVPETLHSTRAFHADLGAQRVRIEAELVPVAQAALDAARAQVAALRTEWAEADAAARKLHEIHALSARTQRRKRERIGDREAEDLSAAQSQQRTG